MTLALALSLCLHFSPSKYAKSMSKSVDTSKCGCRASLEVLYSQKYFAEHCGGKSRTCCMQPSMAWFLAHVTAGALICIRCASLGRSRTDTRVIGAQAIANGVAVPGFSASLGYFDTYRRETVPANLVQVSFTCTGAACVLYPACVSTHPQSPAPDAEPAACIAGCIQVLSQLAGQNMGRGIRQRSPCCCCP